MVTVCRLLRGGASLSMLHEAPVPKERNEGSEEHAQPLSLVAMLSQMKKFVYTNPNNQLQSGSAEYVILTNKATNASKGAVSEQITQADDWNYQSCI